MTLSTHQIERLRELKKRIEAGDALPGEASYIFQLIHILTTGDAAEAERWGQDVLCNCGHFLGSHMHGPYLRLTGCEVHGCGCKHFSPLPQQPTGKEGDEICAAPVTTVQPPAEHSAQYTDQTKGASNVAAESPIPSAGDKLTEEQARAILVEDGRKHAEWLGKPLDKNGWLDLLMRCQDGRATCLFVLEKIEHELSTLTTTPDPSLPPLDPVTPKRKMVIEIEVAENFEKRLDNQWMVEREINADRWSWRWADETPEKHSDKSAGEASK